MVQSQTILRPGRNVWRIERAERAAVLIDGAAYFQAVREALLQARHRVFIVGWDVHSQTRFVGARGKADDGLPPLFGDFLSELIETRPNVDVYLLCWDFAFLYATERELFPRWKLGWNTPARVHFQLDSSVPIGSAQHQKLVVIDDAVAFSGGLDVTIRRWDTPEHRLEHPQRVDPSGRPYGPFHDVQMVVAGPAADAIGRVARDRWEGAEGEKVLPLPADRERSEPWPQSVVADFVDVDVGVARTVPAYNGTPGVVEVEQLFLDSIDAAERTIYIENQFLACTTVAERLAQRLQSNRDLEVLIVTPERAESWIEYHAMRLGWMEFARLLKEAGGKRVRLVYPAVEAKGRHTSTMVHSKVMIVDDKFLRVGSANLNNRSMGVDTECDLAIEARRAEDRAAVRAVRERLLADHCGVSAKKVALAIEQTGSLLRAVDTLSGNGHRLRPIQDDKREGGDFDGYLQVIADPRQPIGKELMTDVIETWLTARQRAALIKLGLAASCLIVLTLVWHFTPLAEFADLESLRTTLASFSHTSYAVLIVVGLFVLAGLVAFPLTILIAATAAAFGPVLGMAYAAAGALVSAAITFAIGAALGRKVLREVLGPRLDRVRQRIARRGVIAVAAVRLMPIAPFTIVNLAAGASQIRAVDFILGTALGLAPGLIVLSVLGDQVFRILSEPTALSIGLLLLAVVAWLGVTVGGQYLLTHYWKK